MQKVQQHVPDQQLRQHGQQHRQHEQNNERVQGPEQLRGDGAPDLQSKVPAWVQQAKSEYQASLRADLGSRPTQVKFPLGIGGETYEISKPIK
jgi:hypothetical protein